jgi:hypothetical protein
MPRRKMTESDKTIRDLLKKKKADERETQMSLKEVKDQIIPEPTYFFEVGDRVVYGSWDFSEVIEVCEGGKYYKLHSCNIMTNTNKGDIWHEKLHYETWFRLGMYRTDDEIKMIKRLEEDENIFFNYMQRDLTSLLRRMSDKHGIDLEPEYQRGNVWTMKQKIALIDSIFKNVDIGKFCVIRRPWGDNPNKPQTQKLYEMLDGKQRLTAVWEYYLGMFPYKGKYFYELHPRDRHHLKHYTISYAETEPLTDEQKYRYFLKLNTTGTPVDEEHMNKVKKMWFKEMRKRIEKNI